MKAHKLDQHLDEGINEKSNLAFHVEIRNGGKAVGSVAKKTVREVPVYSVHSMARIQSIL